MRRSTGRFGLAVGVVTVTLVSRVLVSGQTPGPGGQASPGSVPPLAVTVEVVGTTPLPGDTQPADQLPAPVQTLTAQDLEQGGAVTLADALNRRLTGVFITETQGNPFQPDLNYRGYTASPLLGTPQGLSVFMDGVRLNQPFGEVVSWDLIPRAAIDTVSVVPGSNPLFGLNALGGAIAIGTKSGLTHPGTGIQITYGSNQRRTIEVEHGGRRASGFHWYGTGDLFLEDGWRQDSPSDVRQGFGKVGWQRPRHSLTLSASQAETALNGNGLQAVELLARDRQSVYTKPDETHNRATLATLVGRRQAGASTLVSGNLYYRRIRTRTYNGDINEESLDQALYQPGAAERAALAAAGYTNVPAAGASAETMPFPFLRCVGNVLLEDEPAEKCNGLINRSEAVQGSGGGSAQATWTGEAGGRVHHLTVGGAFDRSRVRFAQSTELGYLNPDRSVTGTGAFGDGETGGDVDGAPFDTRVSLTGVVSTASVYAAEQVAFGRAWHLSASARLNRTVIDNVDQITPGGGPGSLDGRHTYTRVNPAIGVTFVPQEAWSAYGAYSEGARTATSIELGCADPEQPCKLPNAMAGDPPLEQVVTRNWESGLRGHVGNTAWRAGVFRTDNRNDIQFVVSEQSGFGYFTNIDRTRRQGLETSLDWRRARVAVNVGYTFLSATFESEEEVNGSGNSTNEEALAGVRGVEGAIVIKPGDHIPLVPRHLAKASVGVDLTARASVTLGLVAASASFARGNENNAHQPDGTVYLGEGTAPGYAVLNLGMRYRLPGGMQVVAQVDNLLDRDYVTAAQLGATGFTATGLFVARPLPSIGGDFPVRQTTFVAPGAPRRAWIGLNLRF